MAKVISVSVSMPKMVKIGETEVLTSIIKEPGVGPIYIAPDGPVGNKSAVHPEAVYAIGVEAYEYWSNRLGVDPAEWKWGHWGENITFSGLLEKDLKIGDILEIGDETVMQVSSPRNPCIKLSWRLGQPGTLLKDLVESGVMGFYLRVLHPGNVKAGDNVKVTCRHPDNMAVIDIPRLMHNAKAASIDVRRALEMPALSDYPKMFLKQRLTQVLDSEVAGEHRWEGWRPFVIKSIRTESVDVRSLILEPIDGLPLAGYQAGQFLTVSLPGDTHRRVRQWSISEFERGDSSTYRISVKRAEQGNASHWIHDVATEGIELAVKAPAGRFVLDTGSPKPVVFISAGIGITPLLAMLKAHVSRNGGKPPPAVWIHGTRNGSSHVFRTEVNAILASSGAYIRKHVFYSRPTAEDRFSSAYDYEGRPTLDAIKRITKSINVELGGKTIEIPGQVCEYYICGPESFQTELRTGLIAWGVVGDAICTESFGVAKTTGTVLIEKSDIRFAASGQTVTWFRGENLTLLELAESVGIAPPNNCRVGACHSCLCRISEGKAHHTVAVDGIGDNQVLLCSAIPASLELMIDI